MKNVDWNFKYGATDFDSLRNLVDWRYFIGRVVVTDMTSQCQQKEKRNIPFDQYYDVTSVDILPNILVITTKHKKFKTSGQASCYQYRKNII